MNRTKMTGDEFISKLLSGERDFSRISLIHFNLSSHPAYLQVLNYLCGREPKDYLLFTEADLSGLVANNVLQDNLRLDSTNLNRAILRGADLRGTSLVFARLWDSNLFGANLGHAQLRSADLGRAILSKVDFSKASLSYANLRATCLEEAKLYNTRVDGANFGGAYFLRTDLRGVRDLNYTKCLGEAIFRDTIVYEEEKNIIEAERSKVNLFRVDYKK